MRPERRTYRPIEPRKSRFEERTDAAYRAAANAADRESGPFTRTHKKSTWTRKKEPALARAKRLFEKKHSHMTRSELAHNPRTAWIYKQFWRHNLLHLVAHNQENEGSLWAGDAWGALSVRP